MSEKFFARNPEAKLIELEAKIYVLSESLDRHRFWVYVWASTVTITLLMRLL